MGDLRGDHEGHGGEVEGFWGSAWFLGHFWNLGSPWNMRSAGSIVRFLLFVRKRVRTVMTMINVLLFV